MSKRKTTTNRKPLRNLWVVVEDNLYPGNELSPDPELEGQRVMAVVEVLTTIPDEPYKRLVKAFEQTEWWIPHKDSLGQVYPVPAARPVSEEVCEGMTRSYVPLVYLAPALETRAWDAVVAHELAHVALGHELFVSAEQDEQQEAEVFAQLCEWGSEREAKKHRAMRRGLDTRVKRSTEKLVAKAKATAVASEESKSTPTKTPITVAEYKDHLAGTSKPPARFPCSCPLSETGAA